MSETSLTKYGTTDISWAAQRRKELEEEAAKRKMASGYLKLPEGKTMIRMAPPWKPGAPPIKSVWVHQLKDPNDLQGLPKMKVPCPLKNHGKACLVCTKIKELRNTGSRADKDIAFAWSSQEKHYAQVVNLEKADELLLWEFGSKVFLDLLSKMEDPETGGDFTHPINGRNLVIDRTGKGMKDTRYVVSPSLKESKFPKPELLNNLMDLDLLDSEVQHDKLEAFFRGEDPNAVSSDPEYIPPSE